MTKRQLIIEHIRIAAYHGDMFTATRLFCENRISREAYDKAIHTGRSQAAAAASKGGVK